MAESLWMIGGAVTGVGVAALVALLAPLTVIEAALAGGVLTVAGLVTGMACGMRRADRKHARGRRR
jgi:predicted CDP-diglyceride synthetase/phosphatidate cytidylyltransferase